MLRILKKLFIKLKRIMATIIGRGQITVHIAEPGEKGDSGDKGDTGGKGDKGDTGDKGATGAQGPQGATGSAGTSGPGVVYRGAFSPYLQYYNNPLRRDIVNNGGMYYIYKGPNESSGAWDAANWEGFGSQFSSVATDLLLAQLAYIDNLGVKNLRTSPSGQRVEITQARNSMAFYTADQTDPVLEIKTTSDPIYMGQGAGFQIKQPNARISIFKGYLHQGGEGSGVSIPVLPWGQPESIGQVCVLQEYKDSGEGKYKTALYIANSSAQGTGDKADKMTAIHIEQGGIFLGGKYDTLRSNNVFGGLVAAGKVKKDGTFLKSWVLSFMGGYLTSKRLSTGRYRIRFSNTSYLITEGYNVIIMPDGPQDPNANYGAYGCTMDRSAYFFDVWTADDSSTNDCGFTFIVFTTNRFW